MRKAIQASALVLFLTVAAHAGDMQCGSPTPPPPTTNGVMETGAQVALSLLQSLLSLF